MSIAILTGHTYAIGLGGSTFTPSSDVSRALAAQGYAFPSVADAARLAWSGWNPVVYYAERSAPIRSSAGGAFVAISYRIGPSASVQGYPGEVSVLQAFGRDVIWVLDVNPNQATGWALADTPSAPSAVEADAPVTPEHVRQRTAIGSWSGFAAGVGAGVLVGRRTHHPVAWSVAAGLGLGLLGSWIGGSLAYSLGELPPSA